MRTARRLTAAAVAALVVALAAGCGGLADAAVPAGPAATVVAADPTDPADPAPDVVNSPDGVPASDAVAEPTPPAAGWGVFAEVDPGAGAQLTVTDVRVGKNDGFDRVVFELEGEGTPGWRVEYVAEAFDDASGMPVDVAGSRVLQVRIAGMQFPPDSPFAEFGFGASVPLGNTVTEVAYRFWFEGYVTAFIGINADAPVPFRVSTLSDPLRLIIDVENQA